MKPSTFLSLFFCLVSLTQTAFAQKDFSKLPVSADSSYGYTKTNPLPLKKGDMGKSISRTYAFLAGLKTSDQQDLQIINRYSTQKPDFKPSSIRLRNGLPLNGNLGILDVYTLVSSVTKDTLMLYVDIYEKGTLMVPKGLVYQP